jgi:hypothetical protein
MKQSILTILLVVIAGSALLLLILLPFAHAWVKEMNWWEQDLEELEQERQQRDEGK